MSIEAIVWVFRNSEAKLGARLVLLALADNASDDGTDAYPGVPTIARKARMSEKGARDALRRLEREGFVRQTGVSQYGTNIYEIVGLAPGENPGDTGDRGAEETAAPPEGVGDFRPPTSAEPSFDPSKEHVLVVEDADLLAAAWGEQSPPLAAHRAAYYAKPKVKTAIRNARKTYELADIAVAIRNYATVLSDSRYFWSHRWTFQEFLDRGLDKFVAEADPLSNFRRNKDADAQGEKQRTPVERLASAEAWILTNAWRLPMEEWEIAEQLGQRGVEGPDRARLVELWREKRERLEAA